MSMFLLHQNANFCPFWIQDHKTCTCTVVHEQKWVYNLSIHSSSVITWLHLTSVHVWRSGRSIPFLSRRGIHVSASMRTASLLHALALLQRGILATGRSVHHRTGLHAMCEIGSIEHLTVDGAEVTVSERTQVLTHMRVRVAFSYRLICVDFQPILADSRQMYSHKFLHTTYSWLTD